MKSIFSVRADLFRVAAAFADDASGVLIEPLSQGGVVMVGYDGRDLIAILDMSGSINAAANVTITRGLLKIAVDTFRFSGVNVRLKADGDTAWIEPSPGGNATRSYSAPTPFPDDWRGLLAPHAINRLDAPLAFDARLARRCSEAAIGLARAAKLDPDSAVDETFQLLGGRGAVLATFAAWPDAVAMFGEGDRLQRDRDTFWRPPIWTQYAAALHGAAA